MMAPFTTPARWLVAVAIATLSILSPVAAEQRPTNRPPDAGGFTHSLGLPPVYKGYAGFEVLWYRPGQVDELQGLFDFGTYRDLGSPVMGMGAIGVEAYGGFRSTDLDGGGRAYFLIPFFGLGAGVDYNIPDDDFDFYLKLDLPVRRSGIFGRGSTLFARWITGRHNTFGMGISVPTWGSNIGKTRPQKDYVRLDDRKPDRLELESVDAVLAETLDSLRVRARWVARLTQPFVEYSGGDPQKAMAEPLAELKAHMAVTDATFPDGHTAEAEIRVYHELLDRAFSIAAAGTPLRTEGATDLGRRLSERGRDYLLGDMLMPYNYLLGQRKKSDTLDGQIALAQTNFARYLVTDTGLQRLEARTAFFVFQTLCEIMEENRRELRKRWEDSRLVWLPLQYGLKPEDHDTQAELDAIIARATQDSFTEGNRVWYVINEQFQWEMARSVQEAEDYHVLWIHDFRGKNAHGKPDELAYAHTRNYLQTLTRRVQAYDETGKLPIYMIFLDQHYFEINKSRLWLRLLREPMDVHINLPSEYDDWEKELAALQDSLRSAVDNSTLLQVERSQFGEDWLKNQIKVQVNITNPADPSFFSFHVMGIIPVPDNIMRDHRKIAFYDVTEDDPYRGKAMFTGMGIGEHYVGANWEDRAIMIQGPEALAVKDAARQLLLNQGFTDKQLPFPLRVRPKPLSYGDQVGAELASYPTWAGDEGRVLQLHNETGFNSKPINVSKAVLYNLMPSGSVLKVPDSLWQSYIYASLLSGSALRGCRVLIISPTIKSAPSAGAPQMARAQGLMGRLIVFGNTMEPELEAANGLFELGLYAPQQGVGDIAGRLQQGQSLTVPWADKVYRADPSVNAVVRNAAAQLDSIGYSVQYLATDSIAPEPKLHLKANYFASPVAWDQLIARPEWAGVIRDYISYLAGQSTSAAASGGEIPDVQAVPDELVRRILDLVQAFLTDLSPEEREQVILYFTVGSTNMDYRSMVMDGEVQIVLSGWESVVGLLDFLVLAGLCEWVDDLERLNELLPPYGGIMRSMSGFVKLGT